MIKVEFVNLHFTGNTLKNYRGWYDEIPEYIYSNLRHYGETEEIIT